MKQEKKIHWGGGITTEKKNNLTKYLPGFPCCCSGYRAEFIKAKNYLTTDIKNVTCQNCLRLIVAHKIDTKNEVSNMFKNQNGSSNPSSKLAWKIVDEIRSEYAKGYATQRILAKKYKVAPSTIGKILRRESWIK